MVHAISLLRIQHFGKEHGVKHRALPDGQPPTVACTVLAQLFGPKDNETEMGAALFSKNGAERNFDCDLEYARITGCTLSTQLHCPEAKKEVIASSATKVVLASPVYFRRF